MKKERYDPGKVKRYYGKSFITKNGSRYRIDCHGKLHGRPNMEGGRIEMIAGGDKHFYHMFRESIEGPDCRQAVRDVLRAFGRNAEIGDYLALTLTDEDARKYEHCNLVTSRIIKIIPRGAR